MKHVLFFLSVILLKSCGSAQNVSNLTTRDDMSTNKILSGAFEIYSLNDYDLTTPLTITFDEAKQSVSGFSGCNRFFGSYKTKGNTVSFSQIGMTKMLCKDESDQIEQQFMSVLRSANTFEITETRLKLFNNNTLLVEALKAISKRSSEVTPMNFSYNATTRGFFERIWVEGTIMKFTNDRSLKDISKFEISEEQLSELSRLYNNINIEEIPSLEAPSQTFAYDAAAIATLEVIKNEKSYKTQAFDHGNPPKPIALFMDKLLSIKESMVKQ